MKEKGLSHLVTLVLAIIFKKSSMKTRIVNRLHYIHLGIEKKLIYKLKN